MVFHSIRHTSASEKLVLSGGDLKAVQGDGGWNTSDMVTKRYTHILDENRRQIAERLDIEFYGKTKKRAAGKRIRRDASSLEARPGKAANTLCDRVYGAPGGTRIPDLLLRRQSLYPAELRAQISKLTFCAACWGNL